MLTGSAALVPLRGGEPSQVAGAIALPFMMGPGTISASVIIGKRLQEPASVFFAVVIAVTLPTISLIVTKVLHDFVQKNKEALLGRYLNITGRVIAMSIGTYAIEMIMSGVDLWLENTNLPTL